MSARTSFYKNTQYHIIIALLLGTSLLLVVQEAMAFFKNNLNIDEFYQLIEEKTKNKDVVAQINDIEIADFELRDKYIQNIHFNSTNWNNINAESKTFHKVIFEDCSLTNINLRSSTLINVVFKNCTLKNVVLNNSTIENLRFENSKLVSTDTNVKNSYRELVADKITFDKTELKNINFFDSKAEFYFNDSKLDDVTGMGLKSGSALYFNNTNANDIDFSSSNLTTLEVKNSTIKNSKANGGAIGRLVLEDSTLDFPISDGFDIDTVISKNTGDIVVAGSPTKKMKISGCPKSTQTVMVGGDKFDLIEIQDCNAAEIVFFESIGKYVSIENATVYKLDFRKSKIDHLKLNNIHIETELFYSSTNIKKLEATNITFGDNVRIKNNDSNIEIKADK